MKKCQSCYREIENDLHVICPECGITLKPNEASSEDADEGHIQPHTLPDPKTWVVYFENDSYQTTVICSCGMRFYSETPRCLNESPNTCAQRLFNDINNLFADHLNGLNAGISELEQLRKDNLDLIRQINEQSDLDRENDVLAAENKALRDMNERLQAEQSVPAPKPEPLLADAQVGW